MKARPRMFKGSGSLRRRRHFGAMYGFSILLFASSFFLDGCAFGTGRLQRHAGLMPSAYTLTDAGGELDAAHRWWTDFGEPVLDELIDTALTENFSIRQAWARLEQADAMVRQAEGAYFPSLQFDVSGSTSRSVFFFNSEESGRTFIDNERMNLSVGASYEVDLWGKLTARARAAQHRFEMSRDAVHAISISVSSRVAETFFSWVAQEQNVTTLQEQLKTNRQFLELTELRFSQGLTVSTDVYQQRQLVASSEASLNNARNTRDLLLNQLSILVGKMPGSLNLPKAMQLPKLPPRPATGLPVDLLKVRPDLQLAMRDVAASDAQAAAALAEMLPSLRLTGSLGHSVTSFSLFNFIDDLIWNLAAGLTQPLFAGGRLKAEAERADAVVVEKLEAYKEVLTQAVHEVENALRAETAQLRFVELLETQVSLGRSALNEATEQYLSGTGSFLRVLTTTTTSQNLVQSLVFARQQLLTYRIQLCRALGGTWTHSLQNPLETKNTKSREPKASAREQSIQRKESKSQ